jgi:Domain of unknown function (DUF1843)
MAKETGGGKQQPQGGTQDQGGGGGHISPQPLYGVSIHRCIAQGDLPTMKNLLAEAEAYLKEYGDVRAAVESLRVEIAKREYK